MIIKIALYIFCLFKYRNVFIHLYSQCFHLYYERGDCYRSLALRLCLRLLESRWESC